MEDQTSFLAWCPHSTSSLVPVVYSPDPVTTADEFERFLPEDPITRRLLQYYVARFSYAYRTDGIFICHFQCALADARASNPGYLLYAMLLLTNLIKIRMGHVHFFHNPNYPMSRSKSYFLSINPVEIYPIESSSRGELFGVEWSLEPSDEDVMIDDFMQCADIRQRIVTILQNDCLLRRLRRHKNSVLRSGASSTQLTAPNLPDRSAITYYRGFFSKSFDKMLKLREDNKSLGAALYRCTIAPLIAMAVILTYWRYVVQHSDDEKMWTILVPPTAAAIAIIALYLSSLSVYRVCTTTIPSLTSKYSWFFVRIGDALGRIIFTSRFFQMAVVVGSFAMFSPVSIIRPITSSRQINDFALLPVPSLELYGMIVVGEHFLFLVSPLALALCAYVIFEAYIRHYRTIKALDDTMGVLRFGNIYSGVARRICSVRESAPGFRDAISALELVRRITLRQLRSRKRRALIWMVSLVTVAAFWGWGMVAAT